MSEPSRKYLTELKRYGIGSGGLGFNPRKERTVFAEEGPGSTIDVNIFDKGVANLAKRFGISPDEVRKRQGLGSKIISGSSQTKTMPSDVSSFSELAQAYSDIQDVRKDPTVVSKPATIEDILTSDPSVFRLEGPEGMPVAPIDSSGAGDEAEAQKIIAENEAQREQTKKSAITSLAQLNQEVAEDEMGRGSSGAVIEDAFSSAMQDYIEQARGAGPKTKELSLNDYKKEFAEATGIDISGKVDKSSALMAFGLALMQNRAGKGFNVGRMLSAVGEAGEAALPALEKAKTQARNDAIAAGKYALETRAADRATDAANQEKLMNRGKYWVYKKGKKGAEFSEFDNGEFVDLNKFELNKLVNTPDFDKNYEFIDASDRLSILKERAKGVDRGEEWDSYSMVSLIGGDPKDIPPELQIMAAAVNPNYKGQTANKYKLQETPETIIRRFAEYQKSINSGSEKFKVLLKNLESGISVPKQLLGSLQQALRNFGIDAGDIPSEVADAKRMLNNLAIDEATNILQESGKTLSDNDRKLVAQRIGKISWTSGDVELIRRQLKDIYDLTVLKPQENLDRAIDWLDQNAGITFGPLQDDMPRSKEELDAFNKYYGTNLTMEDFQK